MSCWRRVKNGTKCAQSRKYQIVTADAVMQLHTRDLRLANSFFKCQPHVIPAQPAARVSLPATTSHPSSLLGRLSDSQVKADIPPSPHKLSARYIISPRPAADSSTSSLLPPPRDRHGHVPKRDGQERTAKQRTETGPELKSKIRGFTTNKSKPCYN